MTFSNMFEIRLDFNQLSKLPSLLDKTPNLRYLRAKNNDFKCIPELRHCRARLWQLFLDTNQIKDCASHFQDNLTFPVLNTLSLKNNFITVLPYFVQKTKWLRNLYISNNPIICLPDFSLSASNLQILHMDQTRLNECDSDFKYDIKFAKLEYINISSNGLIKLPDIVYQAKKLQRFYAFNNSLPCIPDIYKLASATIGVPPERSTMSG